MCRHHGGELGNRGLERRAIPGVSNPDRSLGAGGIEAFRPGRYHRVRSVGEGPFPIVARGLRHRHRTEGVKRGSSQVRSIREVPDCDLGSGRLQLRTDRGIGDEGAHLGCLLQEAADHGFPHRSVGSDHDHRHSPILAEASAYTRVMPETRYADAHGLNIAYQVIGDGEQDVVFVPGWISNIELMWDDPGLARFLRRLAGMGRLIVFDKRGTGLSDPVGIDELPGLDDRMDDLRAVMDAAGSEGATLFGHSEGGNLCLVFGTTYPERTDRLILTGSPAVRLWQPEYPWAPTPEERARYIADVERDWGRNDWIEVNAPSREADPAFRDWFKRYSRLSASPRAAATLLEMNSKIDVRSLLPLVGVPTLLLYRVGDRDVRVEEGRYMAEHIPGAKLVELPGADHFFWAGDFEPMLQEMEEFITGQRGSREPERRLATVLFTDIVASTETATSLGDRKWRDLLERHNHIVREEIGRWRGREVNTAGDGFLATFDGPARAIRCARAVARRVPELGVEVRCGIHTGEVEVVGEDVAGLSVHIGARIAALAEGGEVLVSRTVKDLVVGSGFEFADRGVYPLKGIPDEWQVYAVA